MVYKMNILLLAFSLKASQYFAIGNGIQQNWRVRKLCRAQEIQFNKKIAPLVVTR